MHLHTCKLLARHAWLPALAAAWRHRNVGASCLIAHSYEVPFEDLVISRNDDLGNGGHIGRKTGLLYVLLRVEAP